MGRYTDIDDEIITLAASQHGLVARAQITALQLSGKALRVRVQNGRLEPRFGGRVFRVPGAPATDEQLALGAVLACGDTAFVSHSTAAALRGFTSLRSARPEVTVVLERSPVVAGVRVHRSGLLVERDLTELAGVRVATPERTIVDLSGRLDDRPLRMLARQSVDRGITTIGRITWCAERLPSAPGRSAKRMRKVLDQLRLDTTERESVLEDFVYESIGRFGLPLPTCQHWVVLDGNRYRIDMCYVRRRIAVEADGFDPHRRRAQFDRDRLRGNDIVLAGYTTLAFTSAFTDWQIAATVARALDLPAPPKPDHQLTFAAWSCVCSERAL